MALIIASHPWLKRFQVIACLSFDCEVSECYAAPMLPQLMRANCGVFCVPQVTKKHGLCKDVAITKQALKPRSMSLFGPFETESFMFAFPFLASNPALHLLCSFCG